MDIKVGDQKFVLKDKITGREMMETQAPEIKAQTISLLNLAVVDKADVNKILDLPISEFSEFVEKLIKHFGLDTKIDFLGNK